MTVRKLRQEDNTKASDYSKQQPAVLQRLSNSKMEIGSCKRGFGRP